MSKKSKTKKSKTETKKSKTGARSANDEGRGFMAHIPAPDDDHSGNTQTEPDGRPIDSNDTTLPIPKFWTEEEMLMVDIL